MQTLARKNEWPLDKVNLTVDVTKKFKEEFVQPAREGAYVYGLYMEGMRRLTPLILLKNDVCPSSVAALEIGLLKTSEFFFYLVPVLFLNSGFLIKTSRLTQLTLQ